MAAVPGVQRPRRRPLVGTWVSLGYLTGNHIDAIYRGITRYSYYLLIALAVVAAVYTARRSLRRTG